LFFAKAQQSLSIINLGLETLEQQRLVHDLVFIYKIFYGLCDILLSITFAKSSTRGNRLKLV